jgi:hypothetical protein
VVGLDGGGAEVRARRRQELTGEEGIDGDVVPVEVRPRGWLGSVNEVRGSFPGGCSGAGWIGVGCPRRAGGRRS